MPPCRHPLQHRIKQHHQQHHYLPVTAVLSTTLCATKHTAQAQKLLLSAADAWKRVPP